jgi:hypothetical protein
MGGKIWVLERGHTGYNVTSVHGIFILDKAESIHQFDLCDLSRAMAAKVLFNILLRCCKLSQRAVSAAHREEKEKKKGRQQKSHSIRGGLFHEIGDGSSEESGPRTSLQRGHRRIRRRRLECARSTCMGKGELPAYRCGEGSRDKVGWMIPPIFWEDARNGKEWPKMITERPEGRETRPNQGGSSRECGGGSCAPQQEGKLDQSRVHTLQRLGGYPRSG